MAAPERAPARYELRRKETVIPVEDKTKSKKLQEVAEEEMEYEKSPTNILNEFPVEVFVDVCSFLDRQFVQQLSALNGQLNHLISRNLAKWPPFLSLLEFVVELNGRVTREVRFRRPYNKMTSGTSLVVCHVEEFAEEWLPKIPVFMCMKSIDLYIRSRKYPFEEKEQEMMRELQKYAYRFDVCGSLSPSTLRKLLTLSVDVPILTIFGSGGKYFWTRMTINGKQARKNIYKPDKRFLRELKPSAETVDEEVGWIVDWLHSPLPTGPSCFRKSDAPMFPHRRLEIQGNTAFTRGPAVDRNNFLLKLVPALKKKFFSDSVRRNYDCIFHMWWTRSIKENTFENPKTGETLRIREVDYYDTHLHIERYSTLQGPKQPAVRPYWSIS